MWSQSSESEMIHDGILCVLFLTLFSIHKEEMKSSNGIIILFKFVDNMALVCLTDKDFCSNEHQQEGQMNHKEAKKWNIAYFL